MMGEYADLMIDGSVCMICGCELFDGSPGYRGVKLEGAYIGGARVTSVEAVTRFLVALANKE